MDTRKLDEMLRSTLEDRRLSRAERTALAGAMADLVGNDHDLDQARSRVFAMAGELVRSHDTAQVLTWLEEVVKVLARSRPAVVELHCEAVFSPGTACVRRIAGLLKGARLAVDICVFTITDDRVSREILAAHRRGVVVRVITDDDKAWDAGSDVARLVDGGISVAVDQSLAHMHHKFAIFDRRVVASGSYNWTRSAANENQENLVICDHPPLLRQFQDEFEKLWERFAKG